MFAFNGNSREDLHDPSTDMDSSDAFGEDDFSEADDFDEDKATREQRRKEFDQLCRQNRFGEAPSISSDDSDSDDSLSCEPSNNKSRFVISEVDNEKAVSEANDRFLSYHPGAEPIEFIKPSEPVPSLLGVDKSLSLSLNRITSNQKQQPGIIDKRCDSDPYIAPVSLKHSSEVTSDIPSPVHIPDAARNVDMNGLNMLCQQQRQWLDELRAELFRSKEEWQRESRLLTHKLMLNEGEKRQLDEQNRSLRQRLSDEQMRISSLEQQLREEARLSQRLSEEKLQSERDALAAREEANSLQDQLISLTRTSGLYQERNAMAEKWASERTALLTQVDNLRMQLSERQSYVERAEDNIRQLEERYRQALADNDQLNADRRRIELERDRLTRDLELAHTEARLAVNSAESAKTSTPRIPQGENMTFDASPLVNSTPRLLAGESMLKIELAKALAANRDNVEKIRQLESHIVDLQNSDIYRLHKSVSAEYEELSKDHADLKTKLNDVIEENRRLSGKLRDFVNEADREKQAAVESCRNACMRLHDDAKKSMQDLHCHEIEELQKKNEVAINQLLVEMRSLETQVDDAKTSYLQVCSERGEAEEAIRREYDAKVSELRSLLACETSALQEKLGIKEKQLEQYRINQQKVIRVAMGQITSAIETTATALNNKVLTMSAKLAALYGRFDALSVAFNRLSFHLLANKSNQPSPKDDQMISNSVVQLRSLFLETAQRMREVYMAHSKAAEERNRQLVTALTKAQQLQQRRILSTRNEPLSLQQ